MCWGRTPKAYQYLVRDKSATLQPTCLAATAFSYFFPFQAQGTVAKTNLIQKLDSVSRLLVDKDRCVVGFPRQNKGLSDDMDI